MPRPTECVLLSDDLAEIAVADTLQGAIAPNPTRPRVSHGLARAASTVARALDATLGISARAPKTFVGCLSGRDDVRQYDGTISLAELASGSYTYVDEATGTVLCTVVRYANPRMPSGMFSSAEHEGDYGLTESRTVLARTDAVAVESYEEPISTNRAVKASTNPEVARRLAARLADYEP